MGLTHGNAHLPSQPDETLEAEPEEPSRTPEPEPEPEPEREPEPEPEVEKPEESSSESSSDDEEDHVEAKVDVELHHHERLVQSLGARMVVELSNKLQFQIMTSESTLAKVLV